MDGACGASSAYVLALVTGNEARPFSIKLQSPGNLPGKISNPLCSKYVASDEGQGRVLISSSMELHTLLRKTRIPSE